MTNQRNTPALTIRDGSLKATVWKNQGEKGDFYSVQIIRTYRDEQENWHDSDRFSGSELLRVSRLAQKAYDYTADLREQNGRTEEGA